MLNAFVGAGQGASANASGVSAISFPSNLSNAPIEVLETLAPIEIVRREIRQDSGGPGKHRGGDGITFELELRSDSRATGAFVVNRLRAPAPGLDGGDSGANGRLAINGEDRDPAALYTLNPGDRVLVETGGGGGFGSKDS